MKHLFVDQPVVCMTIQLVNEKSPCCFPDKQLFWDGDVQNRFPANQLSIWNILEPWLSATKE